VDRKEKKNRKTETTRRALDMQIEEGPSAREREREGERLFVDLDLRLAAAVVVVVLSVLPAMMNDRASCPNHRDDHGNADSHVHGVLVRTYKHIMSHTHCRSSKDTHTLRGVLMTFVHTTSSWACMCIYTL
jgi:hypothetical protein